MFVHEKVRCKYCYSQALVKFGKYKSTQLYFCKICGKKVRDSEAPFHMKVSAEILATALEMHYTGRRLKHVREQLEAEFGYYPSKPVLYYWLEKFTLLARDYFGSFRPMVGDTWMLDEMVVLAEGQHEVWIYDVIDQKTRFLLTSIAATGHLTEAARAAMDEAVKRARISPAQVILRRYYGFKESPENILPTITVCRVAQSAINDLNDFELIDRFSGRLANGARAIRSFRNVRTLIRYVTGWWVYYNFFKTNLLLQGRTPAEAAGISYEVRSWLDFIRFQGKIQY